MGSLRYCNIYVGLSSQILLHNRHLSVSCIQQAVNKTFSKQGKILSRLVDGSSKKKRKFIFDDIHVSPSGDRLNLGQHMKNNKENNRRIAVLNSVFMRQISDLLVTGNIGVDVLSKGLEISRVSMTSDFNQLNVFWGSHNEDNVSELESILPNIGYTLRHELSQLRVIGVVPRILFVKDKNFSSGAKVDYLLRMADFGEDHILSELESDFKGVPLAAQDKNKSQNDDIASGETTEDDEVMPAMRHDVFNLNHQLIMNKIIKKLRKSRAIHRFEPNLAIKSDGHSVNPPDIQPTDRITKEERKEALAKFILSRRILLEKKKQNKYKSDKEIFFIQQNKNENDEGECLEVEDYIEEDFDKNKALN